MSDSIWGPFQRVRSVKTLLLLFRSWCHEENCSSKFLFSCNLTKNIFSGQLGTKPFVSDLFLSLFSETCEHPFQSEQTVVNVTCGFYVKS